MLVLLENLVVGLAGFEPTTFGPPDRRANQAAPQPVRRQPYLLGDGCSQMVRDPADPLHQPPRQIQDQSHEEQLEMPWR